MNDVILSNYCVQKIKEKNILNNIPINTPLQITTLVELYELVQQTKPVTYYDTHTSACCGCCCFKHERINYIKKDTYNGLWYFENNKVNEVDLMFEQYSKSQVGIKVDYEPFVCFDCICPKILYPCQSCLEFSYHMFLTCTPCNIWAMYLCNEVGLYIYCILCFPITFPTLLSPLCSRDDDTIYTQPYCWSNYDSFLLCMTQRSYDILDDSDNHPPCGFFGSTSGSQSDALYCTPCCECICFNTYRVDYSFKCDNLIEKINKKLVTDTNIV
jgi:hypothetical protein